MPSVKRVREVKSIQPGPRSEILPDGTITNPLPYEAVDIVLDDGTHIQAETTPNKPSLRIIINGTWETEVTAPMSRDKIRQALFGYPKRAIGGIAEGDLL